FLSQLVPSGKISALSSLKLGALTKVYRDDLFRQAGLPSVQWKVRDSSRLIRTNNDPGDHSEISEHWRFESRYLDWVWRYKACLFTQLERKSATHTSRPTHAFESTEPRPGQTLRIVRHSAEPK